MITVVNNDIIRITVTNPPAITVVVGIQGVEGAKGDKGDKGDPQFPSDIVVAETEFNLSPNSGISTLYARGDHTHGTPPDPIPLHISASDPHPQYQKESEKDVANGYCGLDGNAKIPLARLNTVSVPYGGTGLTTISANKLLYSSALDTLNELSVGNSLQIANDALDTIQDIRTSASPVFSGLSLSSMTAGSVLFAGSGVISQDNSNFYWDNVNKRLRLGITNLGAKLNITTTSTTEKGLVIKGATSQSANLLELQDSVGTVKSAFDSRGYLGIGVTPSCSIQVQTGTTGVFTNTGGKFNFLDVKKGLQISNTRTFDYNESDYGVGIGLNIERSGGLNTTNGLEAVLAITHSSTPAGTVAGGTAANFVFQIGSATGSGTVNINEVKGFNYTLNRNFNIPTGLTYNVTNSYGTFYWVHDGGFSTGGVVNITNYYGCYVKDCSNTGGTKRVNITNMRGFYVEQLVNSTNNTLLALGGATTGNWAIYNASTYDNYFAGNIQIADKNIILGTITGTKIGTASAQKLGFFGATPIVQPSSTGQVAGHTAGVGTAVTDASTFTGGVGTTAYTIGDIVKHMKNIGLLAS